MVQKKSEKGRRKEGASKKEQELIKITLEAPMHVAETALKVSRDILGIVASVKKKKKEK